jgi:HEAT repeat protein
VCPLCGERISDLSERDYGEKLLHALAHPLAEVRMRAIIALGLRAQETAAPELLQCALRHPTDVVEGMAIVDSLARMGGRCQSAQALAELAAGHPARAVRQRAARAMGARSASCDAAVLRES